MPRRSIPGIFCIEGPWSSSLAARETVKPLLEYLEQVGQVRHVHHRARTKDEVLHLLRRWPQAQYSRYPLGYIGFHGSGGTLWVGRRKITLEEMSEALDGRLRGKTMYFGSCSFLAVPKRRASVQPEQLHHLATIVT